jgi:ABC-type lipoprotein release transport system permease subunit
LVVAVAVAAPLAVALAAAYLPGRDAARTDPAETLRNGQPGIS